MRIAVITLTHGRHTHLRSQHRAARSQSRPPDRYTCVAMGDRAVPDLRGLRVLRMSGGPDLPLAAARNHGAADAIAAGSEMLIFLDVDCIPGKHLLAAYLTAAAGERKTDLPRVFCGPVGYLPPLTGADLPESELASISVEHPDRRSDTSRRLDDHNLFWSLSFAMTARSWLSVGGFCESYTGYGGEDTDYAQLLRAAGGELHWVAEARAYHQHHESHDPPTQHVASIVRNARIFHRRWGWYPMLGWLEEFERRGLAHRDHTGAWRAGQERDGRPMPAKTQRPPASSTTRRSSRKRTP
jgi:GT2 family glycosyltransferase